MGEIINKLYTKNSDAIEKLINEIEDSEFRLFPGNHYLRKHPTSHQKGIPVQPDSFLMTASVYALMEFKRIKKSSFQQAQLPREFYLVTKEARDKIPLLILVMPESPPVSVETNGRVEPGEYIKKTLPTVFEEANSHRRSLDETLDLVDESIAWITWDTIKVTIVRQKETYTSKNLSEKMSINRLCDALLDAIDRHS